MEYAIYIISILFCASCFYLNWKAAAKRWRSNNTCHSVTTSMPLDQEPHREFTCFVRANGDATVVRGDDVKKTIHNRKSK